MQEMILRGSLLPLLLLALAACRGAPAPIVPASLCTGNHVVITHQERTRDLTLVRATYTVDDVLVYNRARDTGIAGPLPIFDAYPPNGPHVVELQLTERDGDRRIALRGHLPFEAVFEAGLVIVVEARGDGDAMLHGREPAVVAHVHRCAPGGRTEDRTFEGLSARVE
jgi:hypothetical protein